MDIVCIHLVGTLYHLHQENIIECIVLERPMHSLVAFQCFCFCSIFFQMLWHPSTLRHKLFELFLSRTLSCVHVLKFHRFSEQMKTETKQRKWVRPKTNKHKCEWNFYVNNFRKELKVKKKHHELYAMAPWCFNSSPYSFFLFHHPIGSKSMERRIVFAFDLRTRMKTKKKCKFMHYFVSSSIIAFWRQNNWEELAAYITLYWRHPKIFFFTIHFKGK